eukprot:scaffold7741_cov62-Skeletonema_dohrnii-CCMP3373.AAC.1
MFLPCDKAPRLPSFKTKVAQSVLDQDKSCTKRLGSRWFRYLLASSSYEGGSAGEGSLHNLFEREIHHH